MTVRKNQQWRSRFYPGKYIIIQIEFLTINTPYQPVFVRVWFSTAIDGDDGVSRFHFYGAEFGIIDRQFGNRDLYHTIRIIYSKWGIQSDIRSTHSFDNIKIFQNGIPVNGNIHYPVTGIFQGNFGQAQGYFGSPPGKVGEDIFQISPVSPALGVKKPIIIGIGNFPGRIDHRSPAIQQAGWSNQ